MKKRSQTWVCRDNQDLVAVFYPPENPKTQRSVHAHFYRRGKLCNHYILRSSYILDEFYEQETKRSDSARR